MIFEYSPKGVCSRHYTFDIEDNKILSLKVEGGCNGNLKGISSLIKGRDIDEVINSLQGISCNGKPTSCPDQIAKALRCFKQSCL